MKKTSTQIAKKASKILPAKKSTKLQKSLSGSDLSQSGTTKRTSAKEATKASKALSSKKTSKTTKSLAGSALSQRKK